jgi:membrane associated rhomboid family serine protease
MAKNKFSEKLKEGISAKEIEEFTYRHSFEVFSLITLIIATISSCWGFFTGAKMSLYFVALGAMGAIISPISIERFLRRIYSFGFKQEKSTQIIFGCVKIIIALFIPFVVYGAIGLLAGTSLHYYFRRDQIINENKTSKSEHGHHDGGDHD